MNNITDVLKEAAGDILTEDVLKQIETVFNESIEQRVALQVEKALVEQDEGHAHKLEKLLEAIDSDHTTKLEKIVEAIDQNHSHKLASVVKKYESAVTQDADGFKNTLVESISRYLDEFLEESIPTESIDEAVRNKKAVTVLEDLRKNLAVNFALSKGYIKDAIADGKQQLEESTKQSQSLTEQNKVLNEKVQNLESHILLSEKTSELPQEKARYVYRMLSDKSSTFINENFDYTVKLFDKTEEEKLEQYKKQTKTKAASVDRPIVEQTQTKQQPSTGSHINSLYMNELNKF
jgi:cell division protein FtsB